MSKQDYFLLFDTETTMRDTVADFGAIICTRKGKIVAECAILVAGVYGVSPLFYKSKENSANIW